jgi:hypothetical protein|tara:strand:- start:16636 stop:16860 length:225 start_codon:yes stop_codon:yes gene_type:complete
VSKDNKKTLEQEAQEFIKQEIPSRDIATRDYFAGAALSGLLGSGKYLRSDEIVNQAFCFSCLMLDYKKNKDKSS